MALTLAQLTTVKNYILADPVLAGQPVDGDGLNFIADNLNAIAVPDFFVWDTQASVAKISNAIDGSKYTTQSQVPSGDNIPVGSTLTLMERSLLYQNCVLAAQTKLFLLMDLTQGKTTLDMSLSTNRASLRDAVIQLPTGAVAVNGIGAFVSAAGSSGINAMNAGTRKARVIEKILITATETTGTVTASVMGFEGTITPNEVDTARRS